MSKKRIVGDFIGCSLAPTHGIIAMDYCSLQQAKEYISKLDIKPTHWVLNGMLDDNLTILYEEEDGVVLIDKFLDVANGTI